jgi:cytochrome c oxidase subunit III
MQRIRLGMALFLLNEAVLFFMLIVAFVYFRDSVFRTTARSLDLPAAGFFTACLIASSLTMRRANQTGALSWITGTLVLGAIFLYGQGVEYLRLLAQRITISRSQFGTTFFTLTGIHALHVLVGLLALAAFLLLSRRESGLRAGRRTALDAVALYWYFVDAVWIVIFLTVYIWALI